MKKRLTALVLSFLIMAGGFSLIITGSGYIMYLNATQETPLDMATQNIYGKDTFVPLCDIPQMYIDAVLCTEDRRFYEHHGVDIISIARSAVTDIKHFNFNEGGSTITQQLAKNLYFDNEKSLIRKVAEVFTAFKIERTYTKDQIFELYANTIYFGNYCYGIGEASEGFYGIPPEKLSDARCIVLAGLPKAPSYYCARPVARAQRCRHVIANLLECGKITQLKATNLLIQVG